MASADPDSAGNCKLNRMKLKTIEEVYNANDHVRGKLIATVSRLSVEQVTAVPNGDGWPVQKIVEHISIVDEGIIRICAKLLSKAEAEGLTSSGDAVVSDEFRQQWGDIANIKLQAPDFVQPTGERTIAESLEKLTEHDQRLNEMRERFEMIDGTRHKFPHPFFGDLSAHEWLVLRGGHEMRHLRQIERLISELKEQNGPG